MKVIPIEEFRKMLDELPDKESRKIAVLSDEEFQKLLDEIPDENERRMLEGAVYLLTRLITEGPTSEEKIEALIKRKNLNETEIEYLELLLMGSGISEGLRKKAEELLAED
jgi:hypothetical protein